jgi:uncharacterized membrane protein YkoI
MKMKSTSVFVISVALSLLGGASVQASEQKVKMKDLPAAVQKTVRERSQGETIRGLSMEVEKGKTIYEAELTVNGHKKDISMDAAGTVVEVEEEVTLESIPAAAKSAIQKAAGTGKVLKVESVTHGTTLVAYEAQVMKGTKKSEVRVKPDGTPAPED